jgi:DNA-binding CsgD family transcriptional regulator
MKTTTTTIEEKLNNRELQLIKWLNKGYTRSEIADKMAMSIHTYDGYRKNIRMKLEIRNQADWAKVLYQVA